MTMQLADGGTVTVTPPPTFSVSVVPPSGGDPGAGSGDASAALLAHINAAEPHPAYDVDMPSLTLLFENGLL